MVDNYHIKHGMNKLRRKFGKTLLNQIIIIRRKIKRWCVLVNYLNQTHHHHATLGNMVDSCDFCVKWAWNGCWGLANYQGTKLPKLQTYLQNFQKEKFEQLQKASNQCWLFSNYKLFLGINGTLSNRQTPLSTTYQKHIIKNSWFEK